MDNKISKSVTESASSINPAAHASASLKGSRMQKAHKQEQSRASARSSITTTTQPHHARDTRLFANNARQLWLIALTIVTTIVVCNGLAAIVLELIVMERNPDWNQAKKFEQVSLDYQDIVQDVVPTVQQWFRHLHLDGNAKEKHLIPSVFEKTTNQHDANSACLDSWFSDMSEHLDISTSPAYIEMVLDNMGLRESILIRNILDAYLSSPQPLDPLYNASRTCLGQMNSVAELACGLRNEEHGTLWDLENNKSHRNYATYAVNMAVVVEVLTVELQRNVAALHEVIDVMHNEGLLKFRNDVSSLHPDFQEFRLQKYQGVALSLKQFGQEMATRKANADPGPLIINILEAVMLDAAVGHAKNARVGLAVATKVQFPQNDDIDWRFGKEWIDSYMAWNMVFIMGSVPFTSLGKRFIPSVVCEADADDEGKDWILARAISLALTLLEEVKTPARDVDLPADIIQDLVAIDSYSNTAEEFKNWRWPIANRLGTIVFDTIQLTPPSVNAVEKMLFNLCGGFCYGSPFGASGSTPHSKMDDEQFQLYTSFIVWITVLLAGLGCEVFVWYHFLQVWDDNREGLWRFAQYVFPLMIVTAFGTALHHDFLSLPFLVAGLWKFGFPETLMYIYVGLFSRVASRTQRISDLLNGIGTAAHHSAGSMMVTMFLTGVCPASRPIIVPAFILIVQHWVVLLHYVDPWLYAGTQLFLEFWFEWTLLSNFWDIYELHWTGGLCGAVMLVAHWIYLLAGIVGLFVPADDSDDDTQGGHHDNVHTRGGREAWQKASIRRSTLVLLGLNRRGTSSNFYNNAKGSGVSSQGGRRNSSASWQLAAAVYDERIAMDAAEESGDIQFSDLQNLYLLGEEEEGEGTSPHETDHSTGADLDLLETNQAEEGTEDEVQFPVTV